jgi:hypothetical protein
MAARPDLVLEVDTTFPGSGEYVSDWIDSGGIKSVRLALIGQSASGVNLLVHIQESNNEADLLPDAYSVTANLVRADAGLAARVFRLRITQGLVDGSLHAVVRAIG